MAQHDFAPAWLNFPTPPSSTKPFLYSDKHSEGLGRSDCAFNVNRQRHSSSDAFDSAIGRPHGGNLAKREKIAWRPQSRAGAEPTWQRDTSPHPYSMKSQLHSENNTSEIDLPRKVDREERKMFEVEDFSSLYPEHERGKNSFAAGLWEYPVSDRSRSSQMLGIKKGVKDDFSLSGYSIAAGNQSLPGKHWAGIKKEECKSLTKESSIGSSFYQDCPHEKYRPNTSLHAELLAVTPCSLEGEEDTNLNNRNGSCPERDINLNFDENKISEDNGNTLMSGQISSDYPPDGVLSSSLEAEFRLLREMGWQEDSENDETCAPLTEDEMKEFQAISEQLQKNGLRKHVFLRNALALDLFHDAVQKEDSETSSSSDTSDDE